MSERKLASIQTILSLSPIAGADAILLAKVLGWELVVKKTEFQVGDKAVYFEIDSVLPVAQWNDHLRKEPTKPLRIKTIRLRGQLSQGLLLPIPEDTIKGAGHLVAEGLDVTDHFGILKWEKPMNAQLAGMARGNFPVLVPKTDQERIQNLTRSFAEYQLDTWSITEKLDGSSCTFYLDDEDVFHVCSRNLDLKEDEANSFWKVARKFQIEDVMRRNFMKGMAIQGEMIGEGIQGNQYKTQLDFYVYDMYNTHTGQYILPIQLKAACERLGLKHVPILCEATEIKEQTIQSLLEYAEGKSVLNGSNREGVVFKSNTVHDRSFKAISNSWLLKNE